MRAIRDTDEMWMRFTLQERILPGKTFEPLSVPGLEAWHKSRPGVRRFGFRQRVRALAEAAIYKVDVDFRWYDAEGNLLRETLKRSRRCRQPGALPNLRIQRIGRRANGQYFVRVGNVGRDVATRAVGPAVRGRAGRRHRGAAGHPARVDQGQPVHRSGVRGLGSGRGRSGRQPARVRPRTTTRSRSRARTLD